MCAYMRSESRRFTCLRISFSIRRHSVDARSVSLATSPKGAQSGLDEHFLLSESAHDAQALGGEIPPDVCEDKDCPKEDSRDSPTNLPAQTPGALGDAVDPLFALRDAVFSPESICSALSNAEDAVDVQFAASRREVGLSDHLPEVTRADGAAVSVVPPLEQEVDERLPR